MLRYEKMFQSYTKQCKRQGVQSRLQTCLERQLQLAAFDDDVGEIQQVNLNMAHTK